jgi:uncharacterized protein (DUF58 family)
MFPIPTFRLALIAALASLVVLFLPLHQPDGLLIVDGLLLVAAAVDAVLATDPQLVAVAREAPAALTVGGIGDVAWRVRNTSGRRLYVAIADELAPSLHATSRRFHLVLPPQATITARASITPSRRGRFDPAEVVVRVDGPLRLASRQRTRRVPSTLRVFPPFRSRKEAELRIERARLLEVGLRSAQGRGGGTEFDALRDYTVDDEVRRIDWAASARSGHTIVRTYRAERNQQVIILLDNGRMMAGQVDGVPRVEWAMDAAMALTAVTTRLGDRCGLVAFDREVRTVVPPALGAGQLARVTEAMYDLDPRLVESDYRGAFAATLARFRRRALLVLLTELSEEAVSETLVPALPLLLGRHLVVVASVIDPDVAAWVDAVPSDAAGAYRAAAALSALEQRGRVAGRLRGLGATVVDAPPAALAGRLADAYLQVKATGRL